MSELQLTYRHDRDLLRAQVVDASDPEPRVVRRQTVTLRVRESEPEVVSFEVEGFSHFVSYHLLGQLFGDGAIRRISTFQTDAARAERDMTRKIPYAQPPGSKRVLRQLLRAA